MHATLPRSVLLLRDLRRPRTFAGVAVSIAILVLIPVYATQGMSWAEAVAAATFFVLPCVALGWLVWRLLARFAESGRVGPAAIQHLLIALAFSTAWTLAFLGVVYTLRPDGISAFLRNGAIWQFVWGLVFYVAIALGQRMQSRLKAQELAAAQAELQALRAQLDPHFLFNTLHSLTQLAREDPAATQDALERFGELMRYVLRAGRSATSLVSLEDELAFVRNYLALERLRLGERLRVVEDIDADALELAVPPLLLQPLVENAVRHGLAPRREGGTIRLSMRLVSGPSTSRVAIEIADDGGGAEAGIWSNSNGLGLRAARRQLTANFPSASELDVETAPGRGFAVRMNFPARLARAMA